MSSRQMLTIPPAGQPPIENPDDRLALQLPGLVGVVLRDGRELDVPFSVEKVDGLVPAHAPDGSPAVVVNHLVEAERGRAARRAAPHHGVLFAAEDRLGEVVEEAVVGGVLGDVEEHPVFLVPEINPAVVGKEQGRADRAKLEDVLVRLHGIGAGKAGGVPQDDHVNRLAGGVLAAAEVQGVLHSAPAHVHAGDAPVLKVVEKDNAGGLRLGDHNLSLFGDGAVLVVAGHPPQADAAPPPLALAVPPSVLVHVCLPKKPGGRNRPVLLTPLTSALRGLTASRGLAGHGPRLGFGRGS
jgi:hypothetical protein